MQPRGRRSELTDPQLHNRRDQLVQIFEGCWAEVGWELPRCKKADDLIRIFTPVADPNSWVRDVVILFCRPCSERVSGYILQKLRGERRALVDPIYVAEAAERLALEQLHQVNSALVQARGTSRRILKRVRKLRRKEYWKAAQRHAELSKRERELDLRLKGIGAGFARLELCRFLKSKRYVLAPISLASAAAGLPHMGWRHSVGRCTKAPSKVANGSRYQIFKAIRYLTATGKRNSVRAFVANFQESIPLLPSRYKLPRLELAEKWLYLERAIRQAYRTKPPSKRLHFEIARGYFQRLQSQTQIDIVLAEQFKLTLSEGTSRNRSTSGI